MPDTSIHSRNIDIRFHRRATTTQMARGGEAPKFADGFEFTIAAALALAASASGDIASNTDAGEYIVGIAA